MLLLLRCRHRRLLRHRFEVAVARTGVSETSTRFWSLANRPHDEQLSSSHFDWPQPTESDRTAWTVAGFLPTNQDDVSLVQGCFLCSGSFVGARLHLPLCVCIVFPNNLIIHRHVLPEFGQFCLWTSCEHQSMRRELCCYVGSASIRA